MIDRTNLGRVGVIANPVAGAGLGALRVVLAGLFRALAGADLVVCAGTPEAEAAQACGAACREIGRAGAGAGAMAQAELEAGATTIVGVGGDGTLAEIGTVLAGAGSAARILGIGVGSSNVGPLVSASAADLEDFLASSWVEAPVHALAVQADDRPVGLAFHDVTVANTFFATRGGRRLDLDAVAALRGEDRSAVPTPVCGTGTWVAKNGRRRLEGADLVGGQVIASPLNEVETCRGRAVSGFLCWGPYVGCLAVVAATSAVMIRTRLARTDLEQVEPLRIFHLGLGVDEVCEWGGFLAGAAVVVDGTPWKAVSESTKVAVRPVASAVTSIRRAAGSCGTREGAL